MKAEPREFQARAVQHHLGVLRRHSASADASVAGAGKTFIASFLAREMQHHLVVVCPRVVKPHWHNAAALCGATVRCIDNYEQFKPTPRRRVKNADGSTQREDAQAKHRISKTGMGEWEILDRRWRWTFPRPTLLVFDEVHYCKTRDSLNSKLVTAARRQGIPTLALSATLAVDPTDLYATGFLLGLHDGSQWGWQNWQRSYGVVEDGFSLKFDPLRDPTALTRLNAAIFPEHGHRVSFADIPGFPAASTDVRPVETKPADLAHLDKLWDKVAELEQLHKDAPTAVVARLRARQKAELLKVPAIVDLTKDLIASGLSVPIFLNFHDSIDAAQAALGFRTIDGRVGDAARAEAIGRFQADTDHGLILQTGSGGVGISLHDTHGNRPRHSLISPGDNARDFVQVLGRNRRVGQKSPAFRSIITLADSIEERVRRALERKADQIETINDGDLDPLQL